MCLCVWVLVCGYRWVWCTYVRVGVFVFVGVRWTGWLFHYPVTQKVNVHLQHTLKCPCTFNCKVT